MDSAADLIEGLILGGSGPRPNRSTLRLRCPQEGRVN